MREQIIVEMTQTASAIYIETQRYWHATRIESVTPDRIAELRMSLDERYLSAHVAGEALEMRLRIYFESDKPRLLWHAMRDLLTVRYFQLIGLQLTVFFSGILVPSTAALRSTSSRTPSWCSGRGTDDVSTQPRHPPHILARVLPRVPELAAGDCARA